MTLIKVAKRVTPEITYYAYKKVNGAQVSYFWRNPYNNKFISIKYSDIKKWTLL